MANPTFTGVLTDVATGAAGGLVGGPIGAGIGALAALASDLMPALLPHLFGTQSKAVQAAITTVVQGVAGTTDPDAIKALSATDPAKAAELKLALAQLAAQAAQAERQAELDAIKAEYADKADARGMLASLGKAASPVQWAPVVVSIIVLLALGLMAWLVMYQQLPKGSETLASGLVETLKNLAIIVVGFWCGSSAGSARKDHLLYQSTPAQGGAAVRPLAQ